MSASTARPAHSARTGSAAALAVKLAPALALALLAGCSALFGGSKGLGRQEVAARGFQLLDDGSYSHAMGIFNDLLDDDPDFALAHYGLGRVFTETGYLDGAAEEFRTAVKLDPTLGEAYLGLGRLYYDMGFHDKAEEQILKARRHGAGESAQALYLLGLFAVERGAYEEAEANYRKSLEEEADEPNVRLALVDLLRGRSRYEDALAELERTEFPRGVEDEVKIRFADCRLHLGQDLEAERLYRELLARDRRSPETRWGLTLLALRRGDSDEAAEQLRQYSALVGEDEAVIFRELAVALESPDARFAFPDGCREAAADASPGLGRRLDELLAALEDAGE